MRGGSLLFVGNGKGSVPKRVLPVGVDKATRGEWSNFIVCPTIIFPSIDVLKGARTSPIFQLPQKQAACQRKCRKRVPTKTLLSITFPSSLGAAAAAEAHEPQGVAPPEGVVQSLRCLQSQAGSEDLRM